MEIFPISPKIIFIITVVWNFSKNGNFSKITKTFQCYTQERIAEEMNVPQRTISRIIKNFSQNGNFSEMAKSFKPYLYNIWSLNKGDETSHFGHFPEVYMLNLLYYHTELSLKSQKH